MAGRLGWVVYCDRVARKWIKEEAPKCVSFVLCDPETKKAVSFLEEPQIGDDTRFLPLPFVKGRLVPHAKLQTYPMGGLKEYIHALPYNRQWGDSHQIGASLTESETSETPSPAEKSPTPSPRPPSREPPAPAGGNSRPPARAPPTATPGSRPPSARPPARPPPTAQSGGPPGRKLPPAPAGAAPSPRLPVGTPEGTPRDTPRTTALDLADVGNDLEDSALSPLQLVQPPTSRVEPLPKPVFIPLEVDLNAEDRHDENAPHIHDPTVEALSLDAGSLQLIFENKYVAPTKFDVTEDIQLTEKENKTLSLLEADVDVMRSNVEKYPEPKNPMTESPFTKNGIRQYHGLPIEKESPLAPVQVSYSADKSAPTKELVLWALDDLKLTKTIWFDVLGKTGERTLSQPTMAFFGSLKDLMGTSLDTSNLSKRGHLSEALLNLLNGIKTMEKPLFDKLMSHSSAIKRKEEKKMQSRRKTRSKRK